MANFKITYDLQQRGGEAALRSIRKVTQATDSSRMAAQKSSKALVVAGRSLTTGATQAKTFGRAMTSVARSTTVATTGTKRFGNAAAVAATRAKTATTAVAGLKGGFASLAASAKGLALGFGALGLINLSDEMITVRNLAEQMGVSFDTIAKTAIASGSDLEITAKNIQLLKGAIVGLGFSTDEVVKVTRTMQQAMSKSGLAAEDMRGVMVGLIDAMTAGELVAGDLEGIFRDSPAVFNLARDALKELGIEGIESIGDLTKAADEQRVTSEHLVLAFLKASKTMEQDYAGSATTASGALTNLKTSAVTVMKEIEDGVGIGETFSKALNFVGGSAERLKTTFIVLGGVMATYFAPTVIAKFVLAFSRLKAALLLTATAVKALTFAMLRNPVLLAGSAAVVGVLHFTGAFEKLGKIIDDVTAGFTKTEVEVRKLSGTVEEADTIQERFNEHQKKTKEKLKETEDQTKKTTTAYKESGKAAKKAGDDAKEGADKQKKAAEEVYKAKKKWTQREIENATWGKHKTLEIQMAEHDAKLDAEKRWMAEMDKLQASFDAKRQERRNADARHSGEITNSIISHITKGMLSFDASTKRLMVNKAQFMSTWLDSVSGMIRAAGESDFDKRHEAGKSLVDNIVNAIPGASTVKGIFETFVGTPQAIDARTKASPTSASYKTVTDRFGKIIGNRNTATGEITYYPGHSAADLPMRSQAQGDFWGGGTSDVLTNPQAVSKLAGYTPPEAAEVTPFTPPTTEFNTAIDTTTEALDTFTESLSEASNLNDERIAQLERELGIARAQSALRGSFGESIKREVTGYGGLPFSGGGDSSGGIAALNENTATGGGVTVEIQNIVSPNLVAEQIESGSGKQAVRNLIENDRSFINTYALN